MKATRATEKQVQYIAYLSKQVGATVPSEIWEPDYAAEEASKLIESLLAQREAAKTKQPSAETPNEAQPPKPQSNPPQVDPKVHIPFSWFKKWLHALTDDPKNRQVMPMIKELNRIIDEMKKRGYE